jgi:hypothetical protein
MAKASKKEQKPPHKNAKLTVNLIDKVKIVAGRLVRVWNTSRKFGSNNDYTAIWVEDANGKNERVLLFTPSQIKVAEDRAKANKEDLTKKDWFTDLAD